MESFEATESKIGSTLFAEKAFQVPMHQRPYTWGEEEVKKFWEDINSEENLYIGQVIINTAIGDRGYEKITDGQQRFTTIMLMMVVVRNIAKKIGSDNLVNEINNNELHCSITGHPDSPLLRVKPHEKIEEKFERLVENPSYSFPEDLNPDEKRLKEVFEEVEKLIIEEQGSLEDIGTDYLLGVMQKIKGLRIVRMEITDDLQALRIFETVNARGVDLSIADLLKNIIMKNIAANEREDAKNIWMRLRDNILERREGYKKMGKMKRFISYYWQSKHGKMSTSNIFEDIKNKTGKSEYKVLLEDLSRASKNYKCLIYEDEDIWGEIHSDGLKMYESLKTIRKSKVTQCYIFLLAIMCNLDKLEQTPKRVFEFIGKFNLSYHKVFRGPGNEAEKIYAKYAKKLNNACRIEGSDERRIEVGKVINSLKQELKELQPSRETFIEGFKNNFRYKRSPSGRYIVYETLKLLERKRTSNERSLDFNEVNVEHLMPRNPKGRELTDREGEVVDKLGNLTLLSRKVNSELGNEPAMEKLGTIEEKSNINIASELVKFAKDEGEWGVEQINKRDKEIAEELYELLKIN